MGANNSKEKINDDLKQIGRKESEIENEIENDQAKPKEEKSINTITNNFILISKSSDPKKDYNILHYIKKGAYSDITLVENKISKMRAIMKTIYKTNNFTKNEEDFLNNELKILSTLDHPSIINIFAFYSNEKSYSYITEFCQEGDLYEQLMNKGSYDEIKTAYIMYQIFSAINYCHKNKIVNHNLSIENILVSEIKNDLPTIKIGCFDTSILAEKNAIETKNIKISFYTPPEAIGSSNKYFDKSDIWSCGVIMYFLLTSRPPFIGENIEEKKRNIFNENFDTNSPPFDKISSDCKILLKKLLKANPGQRPTAEEVLKDIWFLKYSSRTLFYNISRAKTKENLINNIKNYKNVSIFQKYTISYLIHNFPQLTDVKNSAKLFYMIDTDGDGKITEDELLQGLNEKSKNRISKTDLDVIFKNVDLNNSGYIDYEEFVAASVNKNIFLRENILSMAFMFFDKDNSGEITFDEIEKMFKEVINDGETDVHQALKKIMDDIDINIDGKITVEEFTSFLKQLIK